MHFVKLLIIAIALEFMCSIGVIEREQPKAIPAKVEIESVDLQIGKGDKEAAEAHAATPIHIRIQ
jgi:hypothetical protein